MRIAILSSIHWRTPPKKYGPWELVASYIAEGMVKKGHEVTLYATGDSETKGNLSWICPRPIMEDTSLDAKVFQFLHIAKAFEEAEKFDILHNHYDVYPLTFSKLVKTPVVTTMHGFSSPWVGEIARRYSNTNFVSISLADRKHAPELNWIANIYHGIPIEDYPFSKNPSNYFCYIGRISPDKGVHLAVKIAKKIGLNFKIAGIIPTENKNFFEKEIKPHLGEKIEYLGEISFKEKVSLLKNALGFLHLNTYPEGFGLTLVESMACGTPVIGMNKGSIPEVIEDGKTGFVVDNSHQVESAIKKIEKLSRGDCRYRVEINFTVEGMIDEYENVYKKIIRD